MKAMILAAGRGQRLRPLTDKLPKPLLPVAGKPLIYYHLEKLAQVGVKEVVINCAWQAEKLQQLVGDGSAWGITIHWSPEPEAGLETAGGIIQALPLLGNDPFWVINGDVFTRYTFVRLPKQLSTSLAHLVLVPPPAHQEQPDFYLASGGQVTLTEPGEPLTFAGISCLHPDLFQGLAPGYQPLRPVLEKAITAGQVQGEKFAGTWHDVGTPERWRALNRTPMVGR